MPFSAQQTSAYMWVCVWGGGGGISSSFLKGKNLFLEKQILFFHHRSKFFPLQVAFRKVFFLSWETKSHKSYLPWQNWWQNMVVYQILKANKLSYMKL